MISRRIIYGLIFFAFLGWFFMWPLAFGVSIDAEVHSRLKPYDVILKEGGYVAAISKGVGEVVSSNDVVVTVTDPAGDASLDSSLRQSAEDFFVVEAIALHRNFERLKDYHDSKKFITAGEIDSISARIQSQVQRIDNLKLRWDAIEGLDPKFRTLDETQQAKDAYLREYEALQREYQERASRYQRTSISIRAQKEQAKRRNIYATDEGQIIELAAQHIGQYLPSGSLVARISPKSSNYILVGVMKPSDATYVREGVEANVVFTTLPRRSTPRLIGKVTHVTADRIININKGEFLGDKAQGQYYVVVQLPDDQIAKLGVSLAPGMSTQVLINAGERTAFNYLVSPFISLLTNALREI